MFEIFVIMMLGVLGVLAAKKRKRRRFNLRRARIASTVNVGALATLDVADGDLTVSSVNPYRLISFDLAWSMTNVTGIDDGQEFGIAHSDYSAAEIEECLEAQTSIDQGNKVEQERANRLVRSIGMMGQAGVVDLGGREFNNGRRVKTKLNWAIGIGDKIRMWIRNGSGTVYTTGATLTCIGDAWIKDGF